MSDPVIEFYDPRSMYYRGKTPSKDNPYEKSADKYSVLEDHEIDRLIAIALGWELNCGWWQHGKTEEERLEKQISMGEFHPSLWIETAFFAIEEFVSRNLSIIRLEPDIRFIDGKYWRTIFMNMDNDGFISRAKHANAAKSVSLAIVRASDYIETMKDTKSI